MDIIVNAEEASLGPVVNRILMTVPAILAKMVSLSFYKIKLAYTRDSSYYSIHAHICINAIAGATCRDGHNKFYCICPRGYTGIITIIFKHAI